MSLDPRDRLQLIADSTVTGSEMDRALSQTANAGLTYAVIPMPWMMDWFRYVQWCNERRMFTRFDPRQHCGLPGWEFDGGPETLDGDGNFVLCLREPDHEGDCGSPRAARKSS